jgi:hypothetical protein
MGTSNNCHQSSGAPNLPANDSALFSFHSRLFTPKMSAIASYGNYSRSPYILLTVWRLPKPKVGGSTAFRIAIDPNT